MYIIVWAIVCWVGADTLFVPVFNKVWFGFWFTSSILVGFCVFCFNDVWLFDQYTTQECEDEQTLYIRFIWVLTASINIPFVVYFLP